MEATTPPRMYHHNGTHHDDVDLLRRGYEAWNRGELATVTALLHPDFQCDAPPGVVVPRGGGGHQEFERSLRRFYETWAEFRCQPEEFRKAGDLLVALVVEEGRPQGSENWVRRRFFHVWTIRDRKAVRFGRLARGRAA